MAPPDNALFRPSLVVLSSLIKSANYRALTMCSRGEAAVAVAATFFVDSARPDTYPEIVTVIHALGSESVTSGGRNLSNLVAFAFLPLPTPRDFFHVTP